MRKGDDPGTGHAPDRRIRTRTAFPYFDETALPAMPTTWRDISYRGDCPSYDPGGNTTVFIDHAEPRRRQWPEAKRFTVHGSGSVLLERWQDGETVDGWGATLTALTMRFCRACL